MVTFFCPANLFGQTVVAVTGPMLTISITVLSTFPVQLPLTKGFLLGTDTPDDGHLGMFCPFDSWDVCRTGVLGRPNWEEKKKKQYLSRSPPIVRGHAVQRWDSGAELVTP